MTPFRRTQLNMPKVKDFIKQCMQDYGVSREEAKRQYNELKSDIIYVNDKYQVNLDENPPNNLHPDLVHLSIKRLDKQPIHDWRELQQIKNLICGPECEALELYPAEARVVDVANQFHLFVLPPGKMIPCGWLEGVKSSEGKGGAVQRPMEDNDAESTSE